MSAIDAAASGHGPIGRRLGRALEGERRQRRRFRPSISRARWSWGCSWATRPTAGYGVEIVRAVGNSSALVVEYVETAPSRDAITAQVLTAPYHLAAIPKHDGDGRIFRKVDK